MGHRKSSSEPELLRPKTEKTQNSPSPFSTHVNKKNAIDNDSQYQPVHRTPKTSFKRNLSP